ncbi:MAG: glycosyltransferase family 4 protein [Betaproteobacteria bacterium]|jgi:glycosyltransferase involved in cell wall biosynthesis|nr:glycosyltransferase family 4 protein [Betaproteobacteria bacterium]
MRILVVTAFQQLRPDAVSGFAMRQRLFIEAMTRLGAELHILYFTHHDASYGGGPETLIELEDLVKSSWGKNCKVTIIRRAKPNQTFSVKGESYLISKFFDLPGYASLANKTQVDAFESALAWGPDLIFVHRLIAMPPVLRARRSLPPIAFDLDDIESVALMRRLLATPMDWRQWKSWLGWPAIYAGEKHSLSIANMIFVCSTGDAAAIDKRTISGKVISVPNNLPIPTTWQRSQSPNLLMLGNYGHWPNSSGIEYFVAQVWPLIHAAIPNSMLRVAGPGGHQLAFANKPPAGVVVTGYVEDLAGLYSDTAVVVCPIYSGSGTRVKLVEAAGYGIPAVSTPIGAEGLDLIDGVEICIARGVTDFASQCIQLLRDPAKANLISEAARRAAETRFNREVIVNQLMNNFKEFSPLNTEGVGLVT